MLLRAVGAKQIQAKTVLFDSWYGSWQNLKLIHRLGLTFYTTLKANRLVSLSADDGYIHLDAIDWNDERLKHGIIVKLKFDDSFGWVSLRQCSLPKNHQKSAFQSEIVQASCHKRRH